VSASVIETVKSYIRNQEKHHRSKTYSEELDEFLSAYGMEVQHR